MTRAPRRGAVRLLLLLAVAAAGAALLPGARGAAATATIKLRPTAGRPASNVTVIGKRFGASEQVAVKFDVDVLAHAVTESTGAFSVKVRIPATAIPGSHTVTATGQTSGRTASAQFLVQTDWPKFHFDLANSGYNRFENVLHPSNVKGLVTQWSFSAGNGVFQSAPAVVGGVVYIGCEDDKIYARDEATGAFKWSFT